MYELQILFLLLFLIIRYLICIQLIQSFRFAPVVERLVSLLKCGAALPRDAPFDGGRGTAHGHLLHLPLCFQCRQVVIGFQRWIDPAIPFVFADHCGGSVHPIHSASHHRQLKATESVREALKI